MKKIINGKMYNTETAKLIAHWDNNYSVSDNCYMKTNIYLKRTGEYFIHIDGNAGSRAAEYLPAYHAYTPGEKIIPTTLVEVKAMAMKNLEADDYEKIFGEVEE